MNKIILSILIFFGIMLVMGYASAADACTPQITLLNQDPYPAIPGEYVKLVFQVDGLSNVNCGDFYFELNNEYPIQFDPNSSNSATLQSGTYVTNYGSFALLPFKVRINENVLDGDNEIWVKSASNYQSSSPSYFLQKFNLAVNDSKTDFDISIRDYDYSTQTITFDILNTGKNEVESVTVDIPKQSNFAVKGSTRSIIGSFGKDEDTSFTFEGVPQEGDIDMIIRYNDNINVRREINKSVHFDPELFTDRLKDKKSSSPVGYIVIIIIIALIIWWAIRRRNKKRKLEKMHAQALKRK